MSIRVVSNAPDEIRLRETVVERPKFVAEKDGEDLTINSSSERQTVVWTMRLYTDQWRLYRAVVVKAGSPGSDG